MPLSLALLRAAALAALALLAPVAHAQEGAPASGGGGRPQAPAAAAQHPEPLPPDQVTQHQIDLAGRQLAYSATAGTLALGDGHGGTTAEIFYVAFMLADPPDPEHRPITYLFNGGPGASAAYLDIGAVGPRALQFAPDGVLPPPSDRVVDNPDTWLPFTDLVFIDPVGTGYSRATAGDEQAAKQFFGVNQDLDALGDIIRLHLTRSGRLTAPVYLVGESYGGFRAARLAYDLATDRGIAPTGVLMISPVIDFGLMEGGPLDPLPWALRLPSYAAASLGPKSLAPGALNDAEQFALHDYLTTLAAGPGEGATAEPFYARIAQLTGLDVDSIAEWRGRVPVEAYLHDVQRRDGRVVSRYDATVSATDPDPWGGGGDDDPVLDRSVAPFTAGFLAYVRDELGYKTDRPFELLNRDVSRRWDWRGGRGPFRGLGASDALRRALALEPALKVLIAHGVADLQTPFMMSRYIKDQMPEALGSRIALKLYDGGHMLYLRPASRHRLHDDAAAFYGASPSKGTGAAPQ